VHCSRVFRSSVPSDLVPYSPSGRGARGEHGSTRSKEWGVGPGGAMSLRGCCPANEKPGHIPEDTSPGPVHFQGRVARAGRCSTHRPPSGGGVRCRISLGTSPPNWSAGIRVSCPASGPSSSPRGRRACRRARASRRPARNVAVRRRPGCRAVLAGFRGSQVGAAVGSCRAEAGGPRNFAR